MVLVWTSVIQNIADARPKVRYIVAVDDSKNTQKQIVKVSPLLVFVILHCTSAQFITNDNLTTS